MSDDSLKFAAMANAFALIASQRIDDLPDAYQPAVVEKNLRRIAKTIIIHKRVCK